MVLATALLLLPFAAPILSQILVSQLCALPVFGLVCKPIEIPGFLQKWEFCSFPVFRRFCGVPQPDMTLEALSGKFSFLTEIETRAFEKLLDEAAASPPAAVAIKKAQKTALHLIQSIEASCLDARAKEVLVNLLAEVVENSNEAYLNLIRFHSKINASARR